MKMKTYSSHASLSASKVLLALTMTGLLTLSVHAGPIAYTSVYSADAMPNATAGTASDPLWALSFQNGGNIHGVSNGIYSSNTTVALSNQLFWTVGRNGGTTYGTSTAWGVTSLLGATVDFSLRVNAATGVQEPTASGGVMVQIADNANYWTFYFNPTGAIASGATSVTINSLDNSIFQTYRIVTQGGKASLYIAGVENPLVSNISGNSLANLQRLYFGDASSNFSGSYDLNYIAWNNQLAEFSAPVPEPGAVYLLACALIGFTIMRVSRRSPSVSKLSV